MKLSSFCILTGLSASLYSMHNISRSIVSNAIRVQSVLACVTHGLQINKSAHVFASNVKNDHRCSLDKSFYDKNKCSDRRNDDLSSNDGKAEL